MQVTRTSLLTKLTHTREINVTQQQLDDQASGLDLIQNITLLDVRTFHEQPFQDNAAYLGTDVGNHEGGGAAG